MNLALRQGVHAACGIMAGAVLLLLLGTQVLDWRWMAALAAAGVLAGLRGMRLPSRYRLAQTIDHNLDLRDTLSTAWYYLRHAPGRVASPEILAAQRAHSEEVAAGVSLERALPFRAPRSMYLMAALALVATSLFALRYGISRRLDLRPPLARMVYDAFHVFASRPDPPQPPKEAADRKLQDMLKQFGLPLDNQGPDRTGDPQPAQTSEAAQAARGNEPARDPARRDAGTPLRVDNQQSSGTPSQNGRESSAQNGDQERNASSAGEQSGRQPRESAGGQTAGNPPENNSLLSKFRDAMANLLSRLKPQPRNGDGQQMSSRSGEQSRREQARGRNGSQGAPQNQGQKGGDQQGEEQGEGQQQAERGSSAQAGRDAQEASRQGRSGIGRENGSKDVRQAEQLAAMGKLSEILGKRSQNLTGEMMVEVPSGNQQLRTPYSQQSAAHADAGGEIHRDEIPLAYQRYVQQYFEEVRKTAPKPAAAPKQP